MLDVVDTYSPTMDPAQTRERLLVRAPARRSPPRSAPEALETIDAAQKLARRESLSRPRALELRAPRARGDRRHGRGLQGQARVRPRSGRGRAQRRVRASRAAAAADSGDSLAALFLAEEARGHGATDPALDLRERLLKELELGGGDAHERTSAERLDPRRAPDHRRARRGSAAGARRPLRRAQGALRGRALAHGVRRTRARWRRPTASKPA
jgi:hypothetical protein